MVPGGAAGLEGTISGYFEIDDQCGAMLLRALEDAAPPITGAKALTRDATLPTEPTPTGQPEPPAPGPDGDHTTATDGPAPPGRPAKRARPLIYVWTDIDTLVGTGASGAAARLLWDTLGPNPVLSPTAVRRLADDARLQFLLVHHGEVLGVAAPVDTIPAKVRAAVHARDQGCRFPGCAVPIHQTDLHHVIGRANRATPPWPTSSRSVDVTTPLSPTPAGTSP